MPLKKARRLPRKFSRPTSAKTRALAQRRSAQRRDLKRERLRRSLRKAQRVITGLRSHVVRLVLALFFAALLLLFGYLLLSPAVRIQEIRIARTDARLDKERVQRSLASLFQRHTVFLSTVEVETLLREQIPDLASIEVRKQYPSLLHVTIHMDPLTRKLNIVHPDELLAPGTGESGTGVTIDFLTDKGMYVVATTMVDQQALPEIHLVDWGARPQPGQQLLTEEFMQHMDTAEQALTGQFGHTILSREVYLRAQEFHFIVSGPRGTYALWFDVQSSLEKHLQRYRTFLSATSPETAVEYVDLRVTDRVIYTPIQ